MLTSGLSDILSDKVSGASALYRRTLNLFHDDPSFGRQSRRDRALRNLRETFPEMAVFVYLQRELDRTNLSSAMITVERLMEEAEREPVEIGHRLDRIWKRRRRIVTFSQSSLVMHLLMERRGRIDRLLISNGSPHNEGAQAAARYAAAGIDVELATDAALPGLVRRNDYVIVGADCVTERYFVNKCGTLPLLLTASAAGAVSLVVFERFKKMAAHGLPFIPQQHPASEILSRHDRHLRVYNTYFEAVPKRYADWFLSGDKAIRGRKR